MPKYKYECRPCPTHIRAQCIQEADLSPAAKRIIARAFESKTDIQDTWEALQRTCLLIRREQMTVVSPASKKGGLLDRMHRLEREAADEPELPVVKPLTGQLPQRSAPEAAPSRSDVSEAPAVERQPVEGRAIEGRSGEGQPGESLAVSRQPVEKQLVEGRPTERPSEGATRAVQWDRSGPLPTHGVLPKLESSVAPELLKQPAVREPSRELCYPIAARPSITSTEGPGPRMLVSLANGHRILLSLDGELVLGRFDPLIESKPDVDLTYEDSTTMGISRRHARVTGWHGRYAIEDLGSSNGTWINNRRLELEKKQVLHVGDVVRLGRCILFFDFVPAIWRKTPSEGRHFFYSTFTGHYFPAPPKNEIVIGRSDASLQFIPDVDLGQEVSAASVVSRRHARVVCHAGHFMAEDLGSTYHTRVNGQDIPIGSQAPIYPGQHLWLGGYTVAFDVVE